MYLISVDPGLKQSGLAIFRDGVLARAETIDTRAASNGGLAWAVMGLSTAEAVGTVIDPDTPAEVHVIYEMMQPRRGEILKNAKSLFQVMGSLGAMMGALSEWTPEQITEVLPSTWNKSRTKGPNHLRIWERLSEVERQVWLYGTACTEVKFNAMLERELDGRGSLGKREHALEAVGIGLHALWRL